MPTATEMIENPLFDHYEEAVRQRKFQKLDYFSFLLICVYFMKFFQLVPGMQSIIIAFKKSYFELSLLFINICVCFIGMCLITVFVYGANIFEYKNFVESIVSNIRMFILVDNTQMALNFIKYYRTYSLIIILFFIILIRYLFFNMFFAIFMEYERIEDESIKAQENDKRKSNTDTTGENAKLNWKQSKL